MKYCIIAEPIEAPQLAVATLFDLLGDPGLWGETHEVVFWAQPGIIPAEWAKEIFDSMDPKPRTETKWDFADKDWIVLGPTEESLVLAATATGAKYLALDDGLVELAIEDETPEVPVVPDVPEEEPTTEKEPEPVAEVLPEVPATPKRRQSRAKKKTETKMDPVEVAQEFDTKDVSGTSKPPLTVDSVREKGKAAMKTEPKPEVEQRYEEGYIIESKEDAVLTKEGFTVRGEVEGFPVLGEVIPTLKTTQRMLIQAMLVDADEAKLWAVIDSLR